VNVFQGGVSAVLARLIALAAGAATVLAFAPLGAWPLAPLALAWLAHRWMAAPRSCFIDGWWFGLGLFGAGVSWIYISMTQFGGMPSVLAVVATATFCAFLALFPAAAGWLQARVPAAPALRALLLIPAAWTLAEWLRVWLLTGFPWLAVGYASAGWPLQGYAPVAGVLGASFATLALAGALCLLVTRCARALALTLALAIPIAGEALRQVRWTEPAGAPFSVTLLQGNIPQEMKFRPERYEQTLETYARLVEASKARLVVAPETAIPNFLDRIDPAYLARLEAAARANQGDLLLGLPSRSAAGALYNSVLSLGAAPRQLYHKAHLVPFGEFVPPGFGWSLRVVAIPLADFARGAAEQAPLAVAGQRVAVNVCYENVFGDEIAGAAARSTLLVNLSNVAWFGDSLAPGQHLQIGRLRAVETGRMHLAATNTGITAAVDRDGRVLARLPQFTEGSLSVMAQGYDGATPYLRWRDWPIVLASLALLVAAVFAARRSR
jgi:apolipoprotein N-acyltransferase